MMSKLLAHAGVQGVKLDGIEVSEAVRRRQVAHDRCYHSNKLH
jgi:hypothetical protein